MEKLITMLPPPGSGAPPSAEMMKAIQTKVRIAELDDLMLQVSGVCWVGVY